MTKRKEVPANLPKPQEPAGVRAARAVPAYMFETLGFLVQAGPSGIGQGAPVSRVALVGAVTWGCASFKPGPDNTSAGWRYTVTPEGIEVYEGLLIVEAAKAADLVAKPARAAA